MAQRTLQFVVPLIAAAGLLTAAEFWESKPASDWSEKDVKRIMTKSPWAKEVSAQFDASRMGRGGGPGAGGGGGMGRGGAGGGMGRGSGGMGGGAGMGGPGGGGMGAGGGGGMGAGGGGGMGAGGGGMGGGGGMEGGGPGGGGGGFEAPRATVRWLSSAPMQQAALKTDGMKEVAEWSKEFYVVAVSGMRMGMGAPGAGDGGGQRRQPRGDGNPQGGPAGPGGQGGAGVDPQQRMAQMRERMKEGTSLQIGTRGPMQPARVEMVRGETGPVTIFLFPRVNDVSAGDKDIQFAAAMGPMVIKTKFALKEMTVKGKLEL